MSGTDANRVYDPQVQTGLPQRPALKLIHSFPEAELASLEGRGGGVQGLVGVEGKGL